ncbi:uncharacterized protein E0L32_010033 [Thyridium curvatum]|uniref:Alpha-L-rhamnosidase six-hairpin glycosidase domain-containing protein n=1 Tax=Thyridium curvatum TaxID=1093900 RepID=A0A507APB3_9PEZI|nr:uncharacterized protein E0L32_010033 [Thyridium curvatum]TPX08546.1 hypothetical protein E0L32_010033 [Thyridium curvatum]
MPSGFAQSLRPPDITGQNDVTQSGNAGLHAQVFAGKTLFGATECSNRHSGPLTCVGAEEGYEKIDFTTVVHRINTWLSLPAADRLLPSPKQALYHTYALLRATLLISGSPSLPPTPPGGSIRHIERNTWQVSAPAGSPYFTLSFPNGTTFVLDGTDGQHVLPSDLTSGPVHGSGRAWWLPASPFSPQSAYMVIADGDVTSSCTGKHNPSCRVTVQASSANITAYRARPHADIHGDEFDLDFPGAEGLADALAGFYWGTMLPSVIERTRAKDYPDAEGYIISTLADRYVGTYPDVDHEFQIKGRVAWGGDLDLAVVRRMIELELRLMREDYCGLWRAPCAVQPSGEREYNVRRNSEDGETNAVMFLVSGNVEMIESVWLYVARTKDLEWLRLHLDDIEMGAWSVEQHIDPLGRLWSDVYYEDQVIKDGRETMSAALAARAFGLLAELELVLGRDDAAQRYVKLQQRLAQAVSRPLPQGYWDAAQSRFVDWVDRTGWAHDHIHLLANILPVMLNMTTRAQTDSIESLIAAELDEFQRFPTFLSARIADYNSSEIGDGGPYDLCAAGRYWHWDAAYWAWRGNGDMLLEQLHKVASMGATDDYIMGERYDMDYVYYIDGKPWHGAAHYYEYPCVYSWVLFHDLVGVQPSLTADVRLKPMLVGGGSVTLKQAAYQLRYQFEPRNHSFTLQNLASKSRTFELDLSALLGKHILGLDLGAEFMALSDQPFELGPGEEARLQKLDSLP